MQPAPLQTAATFDLLDLLPSVCTASVTMEIVKDDQGRLVEYGRRIWLDQRGKKRTRYTKSLLSIEEV